MRLGASCDLMQRCNQWPWPGAPIKLLTDSMWPCRALEFFSAALASHEGQDRAASAPQSLVEALERVPCAAPGHGNLGLENSVKIK